MIHLTMGEIIISAFAVVTIIVALNAFLGYCMMEWVKRRYKQEDKNVAQDERRVELTEFAIEALQRFNSTIETQFAVQVGIVALIADKTNVDAELPALNTENKRLQDKVRRAMQEAFLASRIKRRRFAAVQELSNLIGDEESLERMKYVAKFFDSDENFASGIEHLERRLHADSDS